MSKLPLSFYTRTDTVNLARELIGKVLFTSIKGTVTAGIITETEAYNGASDKACHAYGYKRTQRTETMFAEGGRSYIYLCYGIHHLFNVVTNVENEPHAVLIRGIKPFYGIETMMQRRNTTKVDAKFTSGPGTISQALGLTKQLNNISLLENTIWIEDHGIIPNKIVITPRIGIDYAEEDALLPYRFLWNI